MGQQGRAVRMVGRKSAGFSVGSLLVAILVVVGLVLPAVRSIPSVLEYLSVKRAASYAKQQSRNRTEVAAYFDKQAQIDDITSIKGEDLDIRESDNGDIQAIDFSYRSEVPVYGPVSLLITYSGTQH